DEPGFVVASGKLDERGSQLFDGVEGPHPQQVFLQDPTGRWIATGTTGPVPAEVAGLPSKIKGLQGEKKSLQHDYRRLWVVRKLVSPGRSRNWKPRSTISRRSSPPLTLHAARLTASRAKVVSAVLATAC